MLEVDPLGQEHPHTTLFSLLLLECSPCPYQNFVGCPDGLIKVNEGRYSLRFIWLNELCKALLMFYCFLYASEILLIFEVIFLDVVEKFLLGIKSFEGCRIKEVSIVLAFFKQLQAHLEIVHFEFYQVVDQNLI